MTHIGTTHTDTGQHSSLFFKKYIYLKEAGLWLMSTMDYGLKYNSNIQLHSDESPKAHDGSTRRRRR